LAKVLCKRIAKLLKENANVTVTCSIGISLTDRTDISYDELYKNADSALYKAKELGKNQCYLYGQKKEEKK
ncbi:MAG: diguanylate cyclase, partial [Oscillospiraceae bacterium]